MRLVVSAVTARMGGALVHLRNVISAWRDHVEDHEIWILVPPVHVEELDAPFLPGNVRLLRSAFTLQSPLGAWIWTHVRLPSVLKELEAEVLLSMHNLAPWAHTCPTVLLVSNALYFSRIYEREIRTLDRKLYWDMRMRRVLVEQSMRAADVVVTPTAALKADILRLCTMKEERIQVAPWGVDNSIFRSRIRQRNIEDGTANLLFVSHHAPHKSFPTLVEACHILRTTSRIKFELTLTISEGENHPHSNRTVAMIKELGLIDWVRLVGSKPQKAAPGLYADADLFIFPSYCESFGLPMVEAMASGLPIVAADTPNNREICGPAAVYFPPFESQALADLLEEVLGNVSLRQSLASAGLERSESFSWHSTAGRLLELAANAKV